MKRIGIVASKIAKGNLFLYNVYVVSIAVLFSMFILIVAGLTVLFSLYIIAYITDQVTVLEFEDNWLPVLIFCMATLTGVVTVFTTLAIIKNIRLSRRSE